MKSYVESIKRCYKNRMITEEGVNNLNLLTPEEKEYILAEAPIDDYKQAYEIVTGVQS